MKVLYGTKNPSKVNFMKKMLEGLDIEIIALNEVDLKVESIDESGNSPLENARIKAITYYKALKKPVFSCDSSLYIEGISEGEQPGVHVRRVKGKALSDDEMIDYYSGLALKAGGEVKARYRNAICFVLDENNIFEYDGDDIASDEFILSSVPHEKRDKGFPLNSLSKEIKSGKYYMDLRDYKTSKKELSINYGYKKFFRKCLNL